MFKRLFISILLVLCAFASYGQRHDSLGGATNITPYKGGLSACNYMQAPPLFNPLTFDSARIFWISTNFYFHDGLSKVQLLSFKDSNQIKLWGSGGAAVTAFNDRTGNITLNSGDVIGALGYTPGYGDGTVTSITAGNGLKGGTINGSGTLYADTAKIGTAIVDSSLYSKVIYNQIVSKADSVATSFGFGHGSVTSITASTPLTGGVITGTGTIGLGTIGTAGIYGSATTTPVLTVDAYGRITNVTNDAVTPSWPNILDTPNYYATNSMLADTASTKVKYTDSNIYYATPYDVDTASKNVRSWAIASLQPAGSYVSTTALADSVSGRVKYTDIQDSAYAKQVGLVDSSNALNARINARASGTVTSITAGAGLSGGTITTTGTISLPVVVTAASYGGDGNYLYVTLDGYGRVISASTAAIHVPYANLTGSATVGSPGTASGSIVTVDGSQTITNKWWQARVGSTTSSGTPSFSCASYDEYDITAQAANITSVTISGTPVSGQIVLMQITGTGSYTLTWGSSFESGSITLPTTITSTMQGIVLKWNSVTSKWRCAGLY